MLNQNINNSPNIISIGNDTLNLPIIDFSSVNLSQNIGKAARETGFFYLKNHGISEELIAKAFKISREFFTLPAEKKNLVKVTPSYRGYVQSGKAKMYDTKYCDTKESFVWSIYEESPNDTALQQRIIGKNNFPSFIPQMQGILLNYINPIQNCGKLLLEAMTKDLGLEISYFTKYFQKPLTRATLLRYPALLNKNNEIFGVSPHTDFGTITILSQDEVGGLQVKNPAGEWVDVPYIPGTLVVNVADLLTLWSAGQYVSACHRVINKVNIERYSIATFIDPDFTTEILPVSGSKEKTTVCGEYIISRIDQAFNQTNN